VIEEREAENVDVEEREFHPVANLFPLLEGEGFEALVEDIRVHGLRHAVVLHEGKIVDGRNRYRACRAAGIAPRYQEWDGEGSLVAFSVSENMRRRDLTPPQKAAVAVDLLPLLREEALERKAQGGRGGFRASVGEGSMDVEDAGEMRADEDKAFLPYLGQARDQAGSMVGVSPRYVSDATRVKKNAPAAFEELRAGTITMPQATVIARAPVDERPSMTAQTVARNAAPPTPRQPRTGEPLHRARMGKLTIDERARYEATVYRSLRALPWRALEALLEFGLLENMTTKTLLRLCREVRQDKGMDSTEGARDGSR